MAQLCAAQIRDWLSAGQQGRALLWRNDKAARPVQASDITVLVRNRQEASLIRDALRALAIPSVYLSNRDSVSTRRKRRRFYGYCRRYWLPNEKIRYAVRWQHRYSA